VILISDELLQEHHSLHTPHCYTVVVLGIPSREVHNKWHTSKQASINGCSGAGTWFYSCQFQNYVKSYYHTNPFEINACREMATLSQESDSLACNSCKNNQRAVSHMDILSDRPRTKASHTSQYGAPVEWTGSWLAKKLKNLPQTTSVHKNPIWTTLALKPGIQVENNFFLH
jgi:hypothetical protein